MLPPSRVPSFRINLNEPPNLSGYAAFPSPHQTLEWHQPIDRWQMLVVSHEGVVSCDGRIAPYGPRSLLIFPPRARCRLERSGMEAYEHIFVWFVPQESSSDFVGIPLVTDISAEFDSWETQWKRAFDRIQFTRTGVRSWMWSVLWHVAQGPENVRTNLYVEEAERLILERLTMKISVIELAKELSISHSQLVRLFRSEHGTTVQEYIRTQRTVRACRLLTSTTHSIKTVANLVGVPDLQQFSKMIRNATGVSPRQMRNERRTFDAHSVAPHHEGTRQQV